MKQFIGAATIALAITAFAAPATVVAQSNAATHTALTPQAVADDLLAADRGFAAAAANTDVVGAWSAMFADEIMLPTQAGSFAKGKAAAIEELRANPANMTAKVNWTPVRVGISADGQHGFTYGYTTTIEAGKPDRPGKYLAYWIRKPEGWRVVALRRAGRPAGDVSMAMMPASLPPRLVPVNAAAVPAHEKSVAAAEAAFAADAAKIGTGPAFQKHGRPDSMLMSQDPAFRIGAMAIGADMNKNPEEAPAWASDAGVFAASSGDLGVSYGYIRLKKVREGGPSAFPFFTVWKRDKPNEPWYYIAE